MASDRSRLLKIKNSIVFIWHEKIIPYESCDERPARTPQRTIAIFVSALRGKKKRLGWRGRTVTTWWTEAALIPSETVILSQLVHNSLQADSLIKCETGHPATRRMLPFPHDSKFKLNITSSQTQTRHPSSSVPLPITAVETRTPSLDEEHNSALVIAHGINLMKHATCHDLTLSQKSYNSSNVLFRLHPPPDDDTLIMAWNCNKSRLLWWEKSNYLWVSFMLLALSRKCPLQI